jgi:Resolvase, N terminal domain
MWADCRQHKIDLCLVFALDRMARSLKHLIEALDEFGRLGVDFVCLKQDIDNYQRSVATVIPHRRCRSGIREGANLQPGKGRHERSTS